MASASTDILRAPEGLAPLAADAAAPNIARLRDFVTGFASLLRGGQVDATTLERGAALLSGLVAVDDWLPDAYAVPDHARYRQYLLHCDSAERFSIVSFVWGPGQATPIHDHRIWGMVGVLRGAEIVQGYARDGDGTLRATGAPQKLGRGEVDRFGPEMDDIHRVANAHDDRVSISIHVYGANIGTVERATYDAAGRPKRFISGYANSELPNVWDRSAA